MNRIIWKASGNALIGGTSRCFLFIDRNSPLVRFSIYPICISNEIKVQFRLNSSIHQKVIRMIF